MVSIQVVIGLPRASFIFAVLATCIAMACCAPAGASSFGPLPVISLPVPPPPSLTAVAGGEIVPHSDYVKVTYVSAAGETTPSDEVIYSAAADTLTVVHSPPAEPGAIGYNVYAIQNSGGHGTGHVRQNAAPIAIGIDYTEAASGWTRSTISPPQLNTALIPIPEKTVQLRSTGGYVEAPTVNGGRAALVLPANDAPPSTEVSLTAESGAFQRLPLPTSEDGRADGSIVLQTIGFASSNDVTLEGFPSFKLTLPRNAKSPAPFLLRLYDGKTKALMATVPAFTYSPLAFLSDYATPFKMRRYRRYYAQLIAASSSAEATVISKTAVTLPLPTVDDVSLSVDFPSATVTAGSSYGIYASRFAPVGLPPISGPDVSRAIYYASITITGTVAYDGPATLKFTLPDSLARGNSKFELAAYDSEFSRSGWSVRIPSTSKEGRTLSFTAKLPPLLGWRQYGITLYASTDRPHADAPAVPSGHAPIVVVVGDSISLLTILPPSGVGCTPGWGPVPDCQYSHDPTKSWPGVLARLTGDEVINLSALGTQTTIDSYTGLSMLDMMIPQIPSDAQVVVCQCGVNDLSLSGQSPATSSRAAIITTAILERAPLAHMIYVGIRCFIGCSAAGIDAWNQADKALASKYGAFIDLIPMAPPGASAAFPDGSHPSPDTAVLIATKTAEAMANWNLMPSAAIGRKP